jgi:hypothetical protein
MKTSAAKKSTICCQPSDKLNSSFVISPDENTSTFKAHVNHRIERAKDLRCSIPVEKFIKKYYTNTHLLYNYKHVLSQKPRGAPQRRRDL